MIARDYHLTGWAKAGILFLLTIASWGLLFAVADLVLEALRALA